MDETIRRYIDMQMACLYRYLEIYSRVLTKEIKLPVRIGVHGLTENGERTVMKEAFKQIRKEMEEDFKLAKPTNEVCNIWIDRANMIRAKRKY